MKTRRAVAIGAAETLDWCWTSPYEASPCWSVPAPGLSSAFRLGVDTASRNHCSQIALRFGCNDFGSLMIEENVVSAAGTEFIMPEAEIVRLIEDADFIPKPRYQDYTLLEPETVGASA